MRFSRTVIGLAAAALTAVVAGAQTIQTIVLEEPNAVPGVGGITFINNVAINNNGQWYVEADTNNPDTDTDVVVLAGFAFGPYAVAYREDQPLASPPGARLDSFDAINLNDTGNSGWNFFLDGTSGLSDDSGIFFNDNLVLQEGSHSTAAGFSGPTPFVGFFEAKINNGNQILVMASMDDPNIPSTVDRALIRVDNPGGIFTETLIAKEGDELLPGRFVSDFETGAEEFSFNDAGDVLYVADLDGDTSTDVTVWLNGTLLAQEGGASPDPNQTYEFLSSRGNDLNNHGDYVFKANLTGNTTRDEVLIVNGAIYRREGQTLPAIAPFVLAGTSPFGTGSGSIEIDDAGNVVWFGDWDDPDTDVDTGLFYNDQLLIREGDTIDGMVVDIISGGEDGFQLSENGRWLIVEVTYDGGINAAVLIELPAAPTCSGDVDDDGDTDLDDLLLVLANFAAGDGGDVDGDGDTDLDDLLLLLTDFGCM